MTTTNIKIFQETLQAAFKEGDHDWMATLDDSGLALGSAQPGVVADLCLNAPNDLSLGFILGQYLSQPRRGG